MKPRKTVGLIFILFAVLSAMEVLFFPDGALPDAVEAPAVERSPVLLQAGTTFGRHWRVLASADQDRSRPQRTCLFVDVRPLVKGSPGVDVSNEVCRAISVAPDLLSVVEAVNRPPITVLGMMFEPRVTDVHLVLGHHHVESLQAIALSQYKQLKAQIGNSRYVTKVFTRRICLKRVMAYGAKGKLLYDGGAMECEA